MVARGLEVGDKVVSENVLLLARKMSLAQELTDGTDEAPKAATSLKTEADAKAAAAAKKP